MKKTILKWLGITAIQAAIEGINRRFNTLENKVDGVENKVTVLDKNDAFEKAVDATFDLHQKQIKALENKVQALLDRPIGINVPVHGHSDTKPAETPKPIGPKAGHRPRNNKPKPVQPK